MSPRTCCFWEHNAGAYPSGATPSYERLALVGWVHGKAWLWNFGTISAVRVAWRVEYAEPLLQVSSHSW